MSGVSRSSSVEVDGQFAMFAVDQRGAAQPVERPVLGDLGQPGGRIARDAISRPALQRQQEGILRNLLGQPDVAQIADQSGGELWLLDPPDRFDGRAWSQPFSSLKPSAAFWTSSGNSLISWTRRISIMSFSEAGQRRAHSMASSRERTSIIQ